MGQKNSRKAEKRDEQANALDIWEDKKEAATKKPAQKEKKK